MAYGVITLEKRIKENIKNYGLENLYPMELLKEYVENLAKATDAEILLTDRHGTKAAEAGEFGDFQPDVVKEPGIKLRVQNRTVGHVYLSLEKVGTDRREAVKELLETGLSILAGYGEKAYQHTESILYINELEAENHIADNVDDFGGREDILTGVFSKLYFERRIEIIDRSELVPIAVINANINDWKFVNDHYGDEESDRLIQVVTDMIKKPAKSDYVIGRTDGDIFYIIIPMPEDNEAEEYCRLVKEACENYSDPILSPSVAMGIAYKNNVEEHIKDKMSDAEYEMFEQKLAMKKSPAYKERLERNIK